MSSVLRTDNVSQNSVDKYKLNMQFIWKFKEYFGLGIYHSCTALFYIVMSQNHPFENNLKLQPEFHNTIFSSSKWWEIVRTMGNFDMIIILNYKTQGKEIGRQIEKRID